MGYLISRFGWRTPYPALALAGLLVFLALARLLPKDPLPDGNRPGIRRNFHSVLTSKTALLGLSIGLLISAANEMINLVFGLWMEDAYSLQIASLGIAAAAIGLAELSGETLTALFTDRLGKPRAVGAGILCNCLAVIALPFLGRSLPGAIFGLFLFYITFEFTLVSTIPLMTELLPAARATLMASNAASLSIGRAAGALLAVQLYTDGILFNSLATLCLDLAALLLLVLMVKSMSQELSAEANSLILRVLFQYNHRRNETHPYYSQAFIPGALAALSSHLQSCASLSMLHQSTSSRHSPLQLPDRTGGLFTSCNPMTPCCGFL